MVALVNSIPVLVQWDFLDFDLPYTYTTPDRTNDNTTGSNTYIHITNRPTNHIPTPTSQWDSSTLSGRQSTLPSLVQVPQLGVQSPVSVMVSLRQAAMSATALQMQLAATDPTSTTLPTTLKTRLVLRHHALAQQAIRLAYLETRTQQG